MIFNYSSIFTMTLLLVIIFALYLVSAKSNNLKKIFIIVSIIYNFVYLVWRGFYTIPTNLGVLSLILSIVLLLAETLGFWQSTVFKMLFWKPFKGYDKLNKQFEKLPTVDVFIATYNEDIKILKKTITASLHLDYPKELLNVYLCDDGRRLEAKALAASLGVHYLSRNDNSHAKAGNINNALRHSKGEFVLLLDADMVPKSSFLKKTLGYFTDAKVGFVQTPQVFYNPDPFQFNLQLDKYIPNEQDFFMMDVQSGRANYNAVLHVGTNAVFRRSALDQIGGIPTGSITEDMATGMLLQNSGYKSIFVKDILCTGLTVENFSDLIVQRERWCRGNIQVYKKWNVFKLKGLDAIQKIIYFDGMLYWFFGVQKMIYIIFPIIYLLFGIVVINASIFDLLKFWVPAFAASILSFRLLSNNRRSISWSHIYEVAMAPYIAAAALMEAIFAKPIPFRVTPKGTSTQRISFAWKAAMPHLFVLVITGLGLAITWSKVPYGNTVSLTSVLLNTIWAIYNLYAVVLSIIVCIERPRKRGSERLLADEVVELSISGDTSFLLEDISETGMKLVCYEGAKQLKDVKKNTVVEIFSEEFGDIPGVIMWTNIQDDIAELGINFSELSSDAYIKIIKYIANNNSGYYENQNILSGMAEGI